LVEPTILQSATRNNSAQVLCDAAAAFKVGTDAIALKVKHEFAAKVKARTKNITPAKAEPAKLKKT